MFNINNHTFTKDLLSSLNNNLNIIIGSDYEYTKGIILTNYLVKQPNIYNLININNINFSCEDNSTINIKQELYFYTTSNNNMKLVLLKLENEFFGENKNKQYLEITLYNYDISVIENDPQKDNNFILNTKDFLVLNDINVFNYIFNRNENRLSVSVNGKNIFSYEYSFDFPDSEGKKSSKNNDTITVLNKEELTELVNNSVRITFFRSILTTITTIFPVICLMIWGAREIFNFNIALLIGFIAGVYSSIYISNQLWLFLEIRKNKKPKKKNIDNDEINEIEVKGVNC